MAIAALGALSWLAAALLAPLLPARPAPSKAGHVDSAAGGGRPTPTVQPPPYEQLRTQPFSISVNLFGKPMEGAQMERLLDEEPMPAKAAATTD